MGRVSDVEMNKIAPLHASVGCIEMPSRCAGLETITPSMMCLSQIIVMGGQVGGGEGQGRHKGVREKLHWPSYVCDICFYEVSNLIRP